MRQLTAEHHVDEARALAATALEAMSCEKLGDHYFSGDGVRVDPLVAVEAMRAVDPAAHVFPGGGHNLHVEDPLALWNFAEPLLRSETAGE